MLEENTSSQGIVGKIILLLFINPVLSVPIEIMEYYEAPIDIYLLAIAQIGQMGAAVH